MRKLLLALSVLSTMGCAMAATASAQPVQGGDAASASIPLVPVCYPGLLCQNN